MRSTKGNESNEFWLAFALGTTVAVSALFFLGTQEGRKKLKKLIELAEDAEERFVETVEKVETGVTELKYDFLDFTKADNGRFQLPFIFKQIVQKIKALTPGNKHSKKLFLKN